METYIYATTRVCFLNEISRCDMKKKVESHTHKQIQTLSKYFRLTMIHVCGLCSDNSIAVSSRGLYSITRPGSMPPLALMITFG